MGHSHDVLDVDPIFTIDADTRTITDLSAEGTALMQYDHNSERLTFDAPKEVDMHDMSLCDRVEVHYINIGSNGKRNPGVYPVDDLKVDPNDSERITFTWLVSQEATKHAGTLAFAIRFACTTNVVEKEYVWNTAIYSRIIIGPGMDNGEAVVTQYADILGAWYNEFLAAGDNGVAKINEARDRALEEMSKAIFDISAEEVVPVLEKEIEEEKEAAIETIHVQADEIIRIVLERLPRAEEASF